VSSNDDVEQGLVIVLEDTDDGVLVVGTESLDEDGDTVGFVLEDVFQASRDAIVTACALALTTIDVCAQNEGNEEHLDKANHAFSWLYAALRDMCEIPEENIRPLVYQRMVEMGTAVPGEL
jgi:hypothetical protein